MAPEMTRDELAEKYLDLRRQWLAATKQQWLKEKEGLRTLEEPLQFAEEERQKQEAKLDEIISKQGYNFGAEAIEATIRLAQLTGRVKAERARDSGRNQREKVLLPMTVNLDLALDAICQAPR